MGKDIVSLLIITGVVLTGLLSNFKPEITNEDLFQQWRQKLSMEFDEGQMMYRFKIFEENVAKINAHNARLGKTYEQGINQFIFLTKDQFAAQYLSQIPTQQPKIRTSTPRTSDWDTIDWVANGAVSPVKTQGSCTATYAFSAAGAIEGLAYITSRTQVEYSVQQLIDCSQSYGNTGCHSGKMDQCFAYVKDHGLKTWGAYPYNAYVGPCRYNSGEFRISGYTSVWDCSNLANALMSRPISVAVQGNNFHYYRSGVFANCGTNLNLAVLLVGMTNDYWKLKNSWGTAWGQAGYIRIARGNTCGVCQAGSYPNM